MPTKKRILLWDFTNTRDNPHQLTTLTLPNTHVSALANWNAWAPPELHSLTPFRPMIRSPSQLTDPDWTTILRTPFPLILFYNEPDRAGVSPEAAATVWLEKVVPELRKQRGKYLCGPSCAGDEAGREWLREWMGRVRGEEPDFIGAHYYGDTADGAKEALEELHEEYPGFGIVVTEVACVSREYREVLKFTAELGMWKLFYYSSHGLTSIG